MGKLGLAPCPWSLGGRGGRAGPGPGLDPPQTQTDPTKPQAYPRPDLYVAASDLERPEVIERLKKAIRAKK